MSPFLSGARCTTAACFVVAAETARGCNKDCYIISELVPWELSIGLSCGRGGWFHERVKKDNNDEWLHTSWLLFSPHKWQVL